MGEEIIVSEKEYKQAAIEAEHAINLAMASITNMIKDLEENAGREVIYAKKNRVKTYSSVCEKCARKGVTLSEISDVAGVKIVCIYKDDIAIVSELLDQLFATIRTKDFYRSPKANGYRSIHKIVKVTTTVRGRQVFVPTEIQIRSALQDAFWSQEHIACYKNDDKDPKAAAEVRAAADRIDVLDDNMVGFRDYKSSEE